MTRTASGQPQVVGKDVRSAADAMGFACAQDNVCMAADRFMTVAAERSRTSARTLRPREDPHSPICAAISIVSLMKGPCAGTLRFSLRFYQARVEVADPYNRVGASLDSVPLPQIGLDNDLGWTHTVSTRKRFTWFELTTSGSNCMAGGVSKPLRAKQETVDVLATGVIMPPRQLDPSPPQSRHG